MQTQENMKYRPITKEDYSKLLELDKKVYPTNNPVTPNILDNWYAKNPEFGMIFENDKGKLEGMCITIPLNKKGWKKLTKGKLAEADLNSKTIFDNSKDDEVGLHIYHIEKFPKEKEFYKEALKGLNSIIGNLRKTNPKLKIAGFSGLCVTSAGIGLFYNKFNCRERKFINSEHMISKKGKLEIFDTKSKEELFNKIKEGYNYINRCKMLILKSDEPSIVWNYLK